ncbi:putative beta-lactamase [Plesiocystis pacifica SIR-1]|uniref:Putative beta-lactamase n=1 Tax=Plesiocystis pacifica SIR-1 TaxID=391625 RepID=A6GB82_9BACT|nr:serine hydrolase domain-containing protein [Plesiocystis pacifica]EDM76879.1 putative beta-lactamase [Plesiocystis pacifica SIR-1]
MPPRALALSLVALFVAACGRTPTPEAKVEVEREAEPGLDPDDQAKRACIQALVDDAEVEERFVPLLRALCAESTAMAVPGVALAVVEGDELVLHAELGVRCFGEDEPVLQDTPFRLGSVTKTLTASLAVAATGADEPALRPDTRVSELGNRRLPPGAEDPTLFELLRHQTRLGELDPARVVEHEGDWWRALTITEPPPSKDPRPSRYSNTNYIVVGAMLEFMTARSYDRLLVQSLGLGPLGLHTVRADPKAAEEAGAACGHLGHDPDRHPVPVSEEFAFIPGDPSWLWPSGGAFASAEELARFALALGTEDAPGTAPMLEPGVPIEDPRPEFSGLDELRYGLGLRSWTLPDGARAYGHTGDSPTFHAELMFVPGERAIVLLANRGGPLPATTLAARALLEG